ncbi:MAG: multidrug transporter [Bacteroidia bacterium]|nr:MAG: multidrug transporter [Bacteroidia bacterium]
MTISLELCAIYFCSTEMLRFFIFLFLCVLSAHAQKVLTIEQCIQLALERNLQIQQARITQDIAKVNFDQTKYNYLPDVSGSLNGTRTFGTSFDQITFQRIQRSSTFSSPRVNLFWTLFSGFANHYTRKQQFYNYTASEQAVEVAKNTVIMNVLGTYLAIIFDSENLKVAEKRLESLYKQLEKMTALVDAGLRNYSEILNLNAQIANEKLNIVNLQNQLKKDKLTLLQLIEEENIEGEFVFPPLPELDMNQKLPSLEELIQKAIQNLPEMKQANMRLEANKFAKKLSFANRLPSISMNGGLGSSYSSNGGIAEFDPLTFRFLGRKRTSYFEQVEDNFNQNIGLTLNVPIFSRWQNIRSYKIAELNIKSAEIEVETTKNTITKQVQQAYLDAINAQNRFYAVQEQLKALTAAYELAEQRYNAGSVDFYTFYETFGSKFKAESDLIQAKYEFWLRLKILEIYQGKNITSL